MLAPPPLLSAYTASGVRLPSDWCGRKAVVEVEILRQPEGQLGDRAVSLQIHILMLDATPQPFDKDVVQGAAAPVLG
jgi:hypothetical protein